MKHYNKIIGFSLAWHMLLFMFVGTQLNSSVVKNGERQEAVFLGALLSKFDIMPKEQIDVKPTKDKLDLLAKFQVGIEADIIPKSLQQENKIPIMIHKDSTMPQLKTIYYQDNDNIKIDKVDTVELDFKIDMRKHQRYRQKALPDSCRFKVNTSKENNFTYIERLDTTGDPELDVDLERFVKEKILYYPHYADNKIKVYIIY